MLGSQVLLNEFPTLQIAYIEASPDPSGPIGLGRRSQRTGSVSVVHQIV